jgi:hypothetical protein
MAELALGAASTDGTMGATRSVADVELVAWSSLVEIQSFGTRCFSPGD